WRDPVVELVGPDRSTRPVTLDEPRHARLGDVERAMLRAQLGVGVLEHDPPQPIVERQPRRRRDRLDALAQALALALDCAVMTKWIVAWSSEQGLGRGRAAGHAGLG